MFTSAPKLKPSYRIVYEILHKCIILATTTTTKSFRASDDLLAVHTWKINTDFLMAQYFCGRQISLHMELILWTQLRLSQHIFIDPRQSISMSFRTIWSHRKYFKPRILSVQRTFSRNRSTFLINFTWVIFVERPKTSPVLRFFDTDSWISRILGIFLSQMRKRIRCSSGMKESKEHAICIYASI